MSAKHHFPALLASTVHDIKNSLGVVLQSINDIANKYSKIPELQQLEFETHRVNNSLMQLLVLYKVDTDKFTLDIDEHSVLDILQDVSAQQQALLHGKPIDLSIDCREDLLVFCDYQQICNALATLVNNAQRYCTNRIHLSAQQSDDFICLTLEDDGAGYPENMLNIDLENLDNMDWVTGSTGLGLHFVSTIARLHQNKTLQGFVKIDNNSQLGGARFRLFLP